MKVQFNRITIDIDFKDFAMAEGLWNGIRDMRDKFLRLLGLDLIV